MPTYQQAGQSLIFFLALAIPAASVHADAQFNTVYNFTGSADGAAPVGDLIQAPNGSLYGACASGGNGTFVDYGGTLFAVTTGGAIQPWFQFAALADRTGATNSTGADPVVGLMQGRDGNFYGTAYIGGYSSSPIGTVFRVDYAGHFKVLHSFGSSTDASEGTSPEARLLPGTDGYLYGETQTGGTNDAGTIFKISPLGDTTYYAVLHQFNFATDGNTPGGGLVQGPDGYMWGMSLYSSIIFKINTHGDFHVVYQFSGNDGNLISSTTDNSLVWEQGFFYGAAPTGGTNNDGTIYRIATNGNFSVIYTFSATDVNGFNPDGANPNGLMAASDGNLYGTTQAGGTNGYGTVFEVTTNGVFTNLYTFNGVTDGGTPQAGLLEASDGNLYGLCSSGGSGGGGIVYNITGLALPPPPPIVVPVGHGPGNTFALNCFGTTNNTYRVQASTNLAAGASGWFNLTNFVPPASPCTFVDQNATNASRFYRLVSP